MMGMKKEGKKDLFEGKMPKKMEKVTVMADSKEGLVKGLSKAEQIMKAKLGEKAYEEAEGEDEMEGEEMEEKECGKCGKIPCKCD